MEKDLIKFIKLSCQLMEAANRCQLCLSKNLPGKQEFEEGNFKRRTPEFYEEIKSLVLEVSEKTDIYVNYMKSVAEKFMPSEEKPLEFGYNMIGFERRVESKLKLDKSILAAKLMKRKYKETFECIRLVYVNLKSLIDHAAEDSTDICEIIRIENMDINPNIENLDLTPLPVDQLDPDEAEYFESIKNKEGI